MDLKDNFDVIVVGGGISGCICASKIKGLKVLIIEANNRLMNKIYATGNGRCNITNYNLDIDRYNTDDIEKVKYLYNLKDNYEFIKYLNTLGLYVTAIDGYVYPRNFESKSVVFAIENSIDCDVLLNEEVLKINKLSDSYIVKTSNKEYKTKYVVIATGSKASIYSNIKTDQYKLSNISKSKVLPSLCGVIVDKKYFSKLAGVRCNSEVTLYINEVRICSEVGQTQFRKNGLSGIQIYQLSSRIARELYSKNKVELSFNYIWDMNLSDISNKLYNCKNIEKQLALILPDKLAKIVVYLAIKDGDSNNQKVRKVLNILTNHRLRVVDVDDYNSAQTCCGGYEIGKLDNNLSNGNEYIIGEVLNVDGICGGYNIQWAYTSASIVADSIMKREYDKS